MMKFITKGFSFLWKTWFIVYMFISTLFFYPFLLISIVLLKNYDLTYKIYRVWAWSICISIGIVPRIANKHLIPKEGNFILVANHSSQLDIIVPYTKFKQHFAFLAKEELKKLPFFNINFKGMNVTVDRKSMVSGNSSLMECADKLKQGINLLIFPEGTRSKNAPTMRSFKTGPFRLAIENQTSVLPLVFLDNYKRLAGGKKAFKGGAGPGISRMVVLDPVSTLGMTLDDVHKLKDKTAKAMEAVINAHHH
ncbi:MAG: 1-acyl-sn-glycerol-3-phosphate acyltransferase [Saprospiraceae bacterium]|jgi:1-acyl-sn-glycerol-3-phosphate acyltransferase